MFMNWLDSADIDSLVDGVETDRGMDPLNAK